ncbi:E3 ubiquitin-protein ligase BRE1A-like isoform X2 [Epinephelus moara]|uniref:E3 ubiquitin-protein ligase BRE1A-like isoform X2 n=1 Tax=Epinephelus moara TaxID=300413 RepID=UPI00214F1CFD|nr:E3 ubiquitin-protein ligase BRE1A-like isoform X2 [Epinephelus moara]
MRQITQRSGEVTLCKILNTSNMSLQVCSCCGWSKHTTYQGLRTHQGKMGCTPKGMRIPESQQYGFNSYTRNLTYNGPPIKVEEPLWNIFSSSLNPDRELNVWKNQREESRQKESAPVPWITPVRKENVPVSPNFTSQITPTEATAMFQLLLASQQHSVQTPATNSNNALPALDFTSAAQPSLTPVSQIISTQASPAHTEVTVKETQKSLFETPERSSTTYQTTTNARRALDFTSNVQVGQLAWDLPTTTAQETAVRPKEREKEKEREREMEREREREREREAQKLQKARQDKIKADLQQKIQTREQKLAEVTSSVKACKGDLDAEWLEINSVFSEVMRVVEDARQKALQPLEERRQRVKREAQDMVKKLQKEIDKLKNAIDELDQNPDSQVSPVPGPNEPRDWKNVTVDTSFSFGSLRTTTSNMIKLIQQKMEKLSSVGHCGPLKATYLLSLTQD